MKILLVAPYLPPAGGGLERYAGELAAGLASRGHAVTLLGHADRDVDERAGGVRRVGLRPAVKVSNTPIQPRFYRVARALMREETPHVVHAHTPVPGAAELAWWAARRARLPFVVTYHSGGLSSSSLALRLPARVHAWTLERAMLRGAKERIAVSRFVSSAVAPGLPWRLAPPGVDARRFRPWATPVRGRVLFVGPLSRAYSWKGFGVLLEAMGIVSREVPDASLRVVGDGDQRAKFEDRAARLGVRLSVAGRISDEALAREYSDASVVALPSVTPAESFGMALAEANACARPVVGSSVGGIPCFVRDGVNGLLARPGDAESLARAIARLLRDDALALRLGARGRAIVEAEHSWDGVAGVTLEAYVTAASRLGAGRTTS